MLNLKALVSVQGRAVMLACLILIALQAYSEGKHPAPAKSRSTETISVTAQPVLIEICNTPQIVC